MIRKNLHILISEQARILFLTCWIITLFTGNNSTWAHVGQPARSLRLYARTPEISPMTTDNLSTLAFAQVNNRTKSMCDPSLTSYGPGGSPSSLPWTGKNSTYASSWDQIIFPHVWRSDHQTRKCLHIWRFRGSQEKFPHKAWEGIRKSLHLSDKTGAEEHAVQHSLRVNDQIMSPHIVVWHCHLLANSLIYMRWEIREWLTKAG